MRHELHQLEQSPRRYLGDIVQRPQKTVRYFVEDAPRVQEDEGATESVLSKAAKGERAAKKEARHLKHDMIQMTNKQKARDELKACGAWSGAAIGICTLTWQGFEEYGAPFPQFMVESEWFFGSVGCFVTLLFGGVA